MESSNFSTADYVAGTAATLSTILGILKAQDIAMTWMAKRHPSDKEPSDQEIGLVRRTAAKLFSIDETSEELNQELMMKAVTALIASYAVRGVFEEGLKTRDPHEFIGFTPTSVGVGLGFTLALSKLSSEIEKKHTKRNESEGN
jgi:Na+/glutamate symporter